MKHSKRSDCLRQTRKAIIEYYCDENEVEIAKKQIDQAWKRENQEELERIQRETDSAWAEYALIIGDDVEETLQGKDNISEYQKNKKRLARREATRCSKKRLIKKAKIAEKNFKQRYEEDLKNLFYHSSEVFKSRVVRRKTLLKRAKRLQH